jgi:flagellar hook protein FlgE
MYSGISGMKVNQVKLDVIGNNIANVGTTAFKSSRTRFQDMLSQNVTSAMAPSLNQGGVNPSKVGLGVKLAGIDSIMSQGFMQPTSRNLDVAVDGEGYFMVSKGPTVFEEGLITIEEDNSLGTTEKSDVFFTRDGSFTLDSEGNLLTSDGYRVLGYSVSGMGMPDEEGNADVSESSIRADETDPNLNGLVYFVDADSVDGTGASNLIVNNDLRTLRIPDKVIVEGTENVEKRIVSFSIEKNGVIKAVLEGGKVSVLGQIAMSSFKNPGGLEKLGSNLYRNSPNSGDPVVRTGVGVGTVAGEDGTVGTDNSRGYGDMLQGMLEMSNVDLAEQFTDMIVTTRAFQAAGKMINSGDEILQDIINLKR